MLGEYPILNNRYKLLDRIGSGGMSVVYKAEDTSLGRLVAVKMLHESLTGDQGFLLRFRHEAHAAANLTHSNIVTVHDIGQDGNRHYIVMEFIDGRTLKQIIREYNNNGRPMPINRALDLSIQICAGIGYAHRAHLVHCDVKPQNVLVTRDDRVKVADFGIARAITEASQQLNEQVWGTPQYFSPEQAAGEPPSPASDVYSIGVILFELLSGRLPFQAESHTALALKHLQEAPPLVTEYNPAVPRQLEQIVVKVLSKEPSGRYRTAGQLGRILSTYRQSSLAETGPVYPVTSIHSTQLVSEQKTQVHQHIPATRQQLYANPTTTSPAQPATRHMNMLPLPQETADQGPDWIAISLGIVALISLLGLIPLWYMVYRAWAG